MKIFIENYNIVDILNKKNNFDKYYEKTYNRIDIFSPEGMFIIDESSMYKLTNIVDRPLKILNNFYKNTSLILDETLYNKNEVFQLPVNHIQINTVSFIYKINNTKMIIEGTYNNNHNVVIDKYEEFTPTDIYFTDFGINEINVFLMALN